MPTEIRIVALVILGLMSSRGTSAEPPANPEESATAGSLLSFKPRTLGGLQLWSDQLVFHEWRIQLHAMTGHHRLLDGKNVRRALGSFAHCREVLDKYRRQQQLPPITGKVVLLLHGLGRSRGSLSGMAAYLRKHSDFVVLRVSYASTRHEIGQHAKSLAAVIQNIPDAEEINFVAHSMGNLVIRHYFADCESGPETEACCRIKRIVMLAPPNQGAMLAHRFRDMRAFQLLSGAGGQQIANWETVIDKLSTPSCEFGIIAGGTGGKRGYNPLISGDNDLIVAVEETKLAGASDFAVVPAWHTTIMDHSLVRQYTLSYLQDGYFQSADKRSPLR